MYIYITSLLYISNSIINHKHIMQYHVMYNLYLLHSTIYNIKKLMYIYIYMILYLNIHYIILYNMIYI